MKNELEQLVPASTIPTEHRFSTLSSCAIILPLVEAGPALAGCLSSLVNAAGPLPDHGTAAIYVVLAGHDAHAAAIASQFPVHVITTDRSDAAVMRSIGARAAITAGAHWLAFTEPTAVVSETWLTDQLECQAAVVLGSVEVTDQFMLTGRPMDSSIEFFHDEDSVDCANFGLDARAFVLLQHVAERNAGIDRSLARRLKGLGVPIKRCAKPHVYRRLEDSPETELLADFAVTQLSHATRPMALS